MLTDTMQLAEDALRAETPVEASTRFHDAMRKIGASYQQTRLYTRPTGRLTSEKHFAAGGVIARFAPPGWDRTEAFHYVCFTVNPLVDAIRQSRTRYRFGDFALHDTRGYGDYWDAFGEASIGEALCATSYGQGGLIASLHLGFPYADIDPDEARTIQLAGLMLTERLLDFAEPEAALSPSLTTRERDALAFVAEGKTDWEISVILGISEATARFHVDNARVKLNAVNRAQAVAKLMSYGL